MVVPTEPTSGRGKLCSHIAMNMACLKARTLATKGYGTFHINGKHAYQGEGSNIEHLKEDSASHVPRHHISPSPDLSQRLIAINT